MAENQPNTYTRLHSSYIPPDEDGNVEIIITVEMTDGNSFRINDEAECRVDVTAKEGYVTEVLIHKLDKKGTIVHSYQCKEIYSPYDTQEIKTETREKAVVLKLKKTTSDPWSVSEFR